MKSMIINQEILAQRLERAAEAYTAAAANTHGPKLQAALHAQANESRAWANAFRNCGSIGFDGDELEVMYS